MEMNHSTQLWVCLWYIRFLWFLTFPKVMFFCKKKKKIQISLKDTRGHSQYWLCYFSLFFSLLKSSFYRMRTASATLKLCFKGIMASKNKKKSSVRRPFLVRFATIWFMFECFHTAFINGIFISARMLIMVATPSRWNPITVSENSRFIWLIFCLKTGKYCIYFKETWFSWMVGRR